MQAQAPADAVRGAFNSMCRSNREAAAQLMEHSPHAVTDVSGFGLLGHLLEMLATSADLSARLFAEAVPLLSGSLALSEDGWRSSLYPALESRLALCGVETALSPGWIELLLDPQTSGGLLAALPHQEALILCESDPHFTVIGEVTPRSEKAVMIDTLSSAPASIE